MQKRLVALFTLALGLSAAAEYPYYERPYAWKPQGGVITMDVVKENGHKGGGTWLCKNFDECYHKIREAEERGATQYCRTITIKRDGDTVWHRDYNDPYWLRIKELKSHARGWNQ